MPEVRDRLGCQDEAAAALEEVKCFVASAGLTLHPEKTRVVDSREASFDFLGYWFRWKFRFPRAKSRRKMVDRIRQLTPRKSGQSMTQTIAEINDVTTGWFAYFRHSNWNVFDACDGMIRRRLRRQLLKRHRRNPKRLPRTLRWPNAYFTDLGFRSWEMPTPVTFNPYHRATANWRAVCGRTACTVRREGSPAQPDFPTPTPDLVR